MRARRPCHGWLRNHPGQGGPVAVSARDHGLYGVLDRWHAAADAARRGGATPGAGDARLQAYGMGPEGAGRFLAAADPGEFVHARVNLHNREVSIDPIEPPAVARAFTARG
jgi:hypothetical protein